MGKISIFAILTERPEAIYLAGETITGTMIIKVKERIKINCVKMVLYGFTKVDWTEQHKTITNCHIKHYSEYEEHLNICINFVTKKNNNDLYLEVGDYSYPFSIQLPPTVPTSFEHKHGRVRYSLNGTIDIPWSFDKHVQRSITVISHVDLNLNRALREPYIKTQSRKLCCLYKKSDPIFATLSVLKRGYIPGEPIVFHAMVDNKSNCNIKLVAARLVQSVTLHTKGKSRTWTRILVEVSASQVIKKKSTEDWNNCMIVVPSVCASSNNACRTITYHLVLHINPSGASLSFDVEIPLVIGTIPLTTYNASEALPPSYSSYQIAKLKASFYEKEIKEAKCEVTTLDNIRNPVYTCNKDSSI